MSGFHMFSEAVTLGLQHKDNPDSATHQLAQVMRDATEVDLMEAVSFGYAIALASVEMLAHEAHKTPSQVWEETAPHFIGLIESQGFEP